MPGRAALSPADTGVVSQAAHWLVKLHAGELDDAGRRALQRWREQDPRHERAWQAAESLAQRFGSLPAELGHAALDRPRQRSRRALVKSIVLALTLPASGVLAWRRWGGELSADYRTATGETRAIPLADGGQLFLSSASAADVLFDATQRRIVLHAGELLVQTAPDSARPPRPFFVHTAEGRIRALGTRFSVRRDGTGRSRVTVLEHAVEIQPADGGTPLRLDAGQQARFSASAVSPPTPAPAGADAWVRGHLVADGQPLGDFIAELARFRPGLLRCDPEVAGLHVSGVFQTTDTDRALATLADSLPVALRYRSRYWVSVEALPAAGG